MDLVNILFPTKKEIIAKKVFFCSSLKMIAIKDTSNTNDIDNIYSILFVLKQETDDSIIFLSCNIKLTDIEIKILHSYPFYLNNIISNKNAERLYRELTDTMTPRNMYFSDFNFNQIDKFNYKFTAFRREQSGNCVTNEIYIPLKEYIRVNQIFQSLFKVDNITPIVKLADKLTDIKLIEAEVIERGETYYENNELCTFYRVKEAALNFDINFKINNILLEDVEFYNPLTRNEYNREHPNSTDINNLTDVIPYNKDSILIIYLGYPKWFNKRLGKYCITEVNDTYCIIVKNEYLGITNFIDYANRIIKEK